MMAFSPTYRASHVPPVPDAPPFHDIAAGSFFARGRFRGHIVFLPPRRVVVLGKEVSLRMRGGSALPFPPSFPPSEPFSAVG